MRRAPEKAYGAEVSARRLSKVGDGASAARFSGRAPRTLRCQLALNELNALASASAAPAAAALQGACKAKDQLHVQLLTRLCNGFRSATKRHSVIIARCMHPLRLHAAAHYTGMQQRVGNDEQGPAARNVSVLPAARRSRATAYPPRRRTWARRGLGTASYGAPCRAPRVLPRCIPSARLPAP